MQHREKQKYTVAVPHTSKPEEIIREAIYKRIKNSSQYTSQEEKIRAVTEYCASYVLKVAGSDQYFLDARPISQVSTFTLSQRTAKSIIFSLSLVSNHSLLHRQK